MKLALKIAKRFLLSNKSQSILIISAIAIGISVQLFIGLLIQGLQADLINQTIGDASHITFTSNDENFKLDEDAIKELEQNPDITKVSPILIENSFMQIGDNDYTVLMNGVNIDDSIYDLDSKLVEGSLPKNNDEIIVGIFYEDIEVGDTLIFTLSGDKTRTYTVSGKFDFKNAVVNEKNVYTTLESLQLFSANETKVTAIETQVDKVFDTETIVKGIKTDYDVETWQQKNASLLSALSSQSLSSLIIQVFIVISVTLAISSVLIISVVQKSKQIGILKAMGLNDANVSKVFVSQGVMLGFIGSLVGILIGVGLIVVFTKFAVDDSGNAVINIALNPKFIAMSFSIGIIVSTVASFIPARKSRKLTVMEVISNG